MQAINVLAHVTIRRGDDCTGPAHHMITREQCIFFAQVEANMVGCVARRKHAVKGPAVAIDNIAMPNRDIGCKLPVGSFLYGFAALILTGAVGSVAKRCCTGRRLDGSARR